MARLAGGVPVVLDTPPEAGFLLTAPQLAAALTPRSRVLILCTPSNPTGELRRRPSPPGGRGISGEGTRADTVDHTLTPSRESAARCLPRSPKANKKHTPH
jgi:hypothetical protein